MKGSAIREKLSQLGVTQAALARQLDITPQAVTGLLSAFDVRTSTVERISEVLNLPISFFYGEDEEKRSNYHNSRMG